MDDVVLSSNSEGSGSRREPSKGFSNDLLAEEREEDASSELTVEKLSEERNGRRRGREDR